MVYLDNRTNQQEVWIPRNDGLGSTHKNIYTLEGVNVSISADTTTVTPSSGFYGMSAVTIDASDYAQTNYENGFDDGYTDGYSSGASEGYDSGYIEGYDSGSTDGFNSGYTSGETHQKSLLASTAFTENGQYTRENGYSAITVNVPTGETYNIEQNKSFTATTNGNYTINTSEIWSITYDHTFARRYVFTINGTIPQTKIGKIAYIVRYDDEDTGGKPSVVIIIGSGNTLTINKNNWDEDDYGDVDFMLFQGKYRLEFDDDLDSTEFSIIPYSNREKYDAMSAVSLTVNVTSSVPKYVEYIETDGSEIMFDLDTMLTSTAETVYFDFMPLSGVGQYDAWYSFVDADNLGLRTRWAGYNPNGKYGYKFGNYNQFNNWSIGPSFSAGTKYECVFTSTGSSVNDSVTTYQASSIGTPSSIRLNGWTGDGYTSRCPIARYYGFKIMSGNTVISDFRPFLDTNNVPCFYEEVSQTYIYASGSGTPISGPTFDYVSGFTDGQNSIISTFTATTATTNGVYGTSANPLSSITVNVPSSSGGSEDFAKLIDRSITEAVIPSGVTKIGDYAFAYCVSLSSVTIPNTVTEIGNYAFMQNKFSAITIPSGCTKIGNYAFQYSTKLPNITIPNSVTSIGGYSFEGCSMLIEVNIGSGVTIINQRAFRNCRALTNIYISATTAPTIANVNAFQGVQSTGTVHYPQGSDYSSWQSNTYLSGWTFSADL